MKTKAKQRYRSENGLLLPGTTTITGLLAKIPLYNWYWELGRDGIDHRRHLDWLAEIGILAHSMIFHYIKGEETNTKDYSKNQIELATNSFKSFLEWKKQHNLEPLILEKQLVSKKYNYGGTPDFYGLIDGEKTLLDFKSSGVYYDQFIQLSAYKNLLEEKENEVDHCRVLVIPTDKGTGFNEAQREDVSDHWETFTHLLEIHKLLKKIRKSGK